MERGQLICYLLHTQEQPRLSRGRHSEAGLHGELAAQGEADAQTATHGTLMGFFLTRFLCLREVEI